jgi:hypothetical protein
MTLHNLKKDLFEFNSEKAPRRVNSSYQAILESIRRDLAPKQKLIPLTMGAAAAHPSLPKSKSPGLPYRLQGYKTKGEVLDNPENLKEINITWQQIGYGVPIELPDVACYGRAVIAERGVDKIRATWGYPMSVYLEEARFFYPILEHLKTMDNPKIAYGVETNRGGMDFISTMLNALPNKPRMMGDWKKFDKNVPAWLIRDAFNILKEWIDFEHVLDSEGKIWHVRPNRTNRRWRAMIDYFINTPVRLSNGERFIKYGGVPSGTCFTNIIDSIVNMIKMRYITYQLTGELPLADIYLGDDSLIIFSKLINLSDLKEIASYEFGSEFNDSKSFITTKDFNVQFLGYFNMSGEPHKPLDTILASAMYPEHAVRHKLDTVTRLIGQAYSVYEPLQSGKLIYAANIIAAEDKLNRAFVEEYIHRNTHMFKYLQTIGVDAKELSFPEIGKDELFLKNRPMPMVKMWKRTTYDLDELYYAGVTHMNTDDLD